MCIRDRCIAFYLGQKLTYDHVLEVLGAVDTDVFSRLLRKVLERDVAGEMCIRDRFTTAKNAALNYKKKHSREIFEIDENWDSEEDTEKYEAQVKSAEEQFLEDELQKQRLELHEKIFTNLMEKNERWYDAIVLVYYMEMPQAKAAELMGIRLEVLHSLLHRAKKWIKKKYGTEYEEMNRED